MGDIMGTGTAAQASAASGSGPLTLSLCKQLHNLAVRPREWRGEFFSENSKKGVDRRPQSV